MSTKKYIILLIAHLLIGMVYGCVEETEVELWGECYNIEQTTILNLFDSELSGEIPEDIGQLVNLISLILNVT